MGGIDAVILVAVLALIGVLYAVVQSERKKGAPLCGRACGGCPHPCNSDGTPRQPHDAAAAPPSEEP